MRDAYVRSTSPSLSVPLCILVNPCVGSIEDHADDRQVISSEACRFLPAVAVSIEADNADCVSWAGACLFEPDAGFDHSDADFMSWFRHLSTRRWRYGGLSCKLGMKKKGSGDDRLIDATAQGDALIRHV